MRYVLSVVRYDQQGKSVSYSAAQSISASHLLPSHRHKKATHSGQDTITGKSDEAKNISEATEKGCRKRCLCGVVTCLSWALPHRGTPLARDTIRELSIKNHVRMH